MRDKWNWKVLAQWMKGKWGIRLLVAMGILGIALVALSEWFPADGGSPEKTTAETTSGTAEYIARLEERMGDIIGRIDGVGACRVMITLENGGEYVYASEEKSGSDYSTEGDRLSQTDDSESSVILVETETGYEGLLITELEPTVKGVVVVCEGGGDETVQQHVTEAVTAVLNVTAKRVCVVAGNGQ